jgi:hypothetical protein
MRSENLTHEIVDNGSMKIKRNGSSNSRSRKHLPHLLTSTVSETKGEGVYSSLDVVVDVDGVLLSIEAAKLKAAVIVCVMLDLMRNAKLRILQLITV